MPKIAEPGVKISLGGQEVDIFSGTFRENNSASSFGCSFKENLPHIWFQI
jgi:hypothetical protein